MEEKPWRGETLLSCRRNICECIFPDIEADHTRLDRVPVHARSAITNTDFSNAQASKQASMPASQLVEPVSFSATISRNWNRIRHRGHYAPATIRSALSTVVRLVKMARPTINHVLPFDTWMLFIYVSIHPCVRFAPIYDPSMFANRRIRFIRFRVKTTASVSFAFTQRTKIFTSISFLFSRSSASLVEVYIQFP